MLSVNFLTQNLMLLLGEFFILTCANGCRLAAINKDFHILAALIIGEIIAILMFAVVVHDLFTVGTFGNEGRLCAILAMLYVIYYSYKTIHQVNKTHDKVVKKLSLKDIIF